ncbi:uncharacterized protein F5147DRAFT_657781 [Suillus discolor]|uniref:Uncharacterized protein n=1 Tax=Suillus discolor TaxID=1912936 RepID=A0A9P7JNI8_9AGAM|nr:uncharacterized protein F5147DRAFT_657781 [Suillus discolor]KAG2091948.1 hypothetical protein F5147DRAFT_657781 [Suillus discolor]
MNNQNQLGNSRSGPSPHIETPNEPNATERPGRPCGKICRLLGKVTNGAIKRISVSRNQYRDPVPPIVNREIVSSIPNIEVKDTPPGAEQGADLPSAPREANEAAKGMNVPGPVIPGVSTAQNTPTNLKDACFIQDAPSGEKQGADPQSALREANKAAKGMNTLSGCVTSGVSAAQNAPADLADACKVGDTYLQPLRIFDSVIRKLTDVHPYAKMTLGLLSSASKIVIKGYSGFSRS